MAEAEAGLNRETGISSGNKKITLKMFSYISEELYEFEAYIYNFQIGVSSTIEEMVPFGRSSRIYTYGGTIRGDITIDFFELVNSHNPDEVNETYARASRILKQMYPQYSDTSNSLALHKAPLFRIHSPAYITNGGVDVNANDRGALKLPYGLLGYIKDMSLSFDRAGEGAFGHFIEDSYAALAPKINYSITFAPIDDADLGFNAQGAWPEEAAKWPMGFDSGIAGGEGQAIPATSIAITVEQITGDGREPLDIGLEATEAQIAALDLQDPNWRNGDSQDVNLTAQEVEALQANDLSGEELMALMARYGGR